MLFGDISLVEKSKLSSFSDPIILIKNMLSSMPIHIFMALLVLETVRKEIEMLMRNFLLSANEVHVKYIGFLLSNSLSFGMYWLVKLNMVSKPC